MTRSAEELFERAIAREPTAVRALVDVLAPVVQLRVARAIARHKSTRALGREAAGEAHDLTQEVFVALFADDARALRAWSPGRGLSLVNFVGLVAEHQVASIFRSGRRRPWSEEMMLEEDLDARAKEGIEERFAARDLYARVLARVRAEVTPRGLELFYALIVEEQAVETIAAKTGMSPDAIYAWRSRLMKLVRKALAELDPEQAASTRSDPARRAARAETP